MKKLKIGITIGLHHPAETLWNNGIKQNAAFLALALRNCPNVESVTLVNTTATLISDSLPWSLEQFPTVAFDVAKDVVDIMIELGGQIDCNQTDYLKARGARLISYCCGSEYVLAMEAVLFRKPSWGPHLFVNQRYDDIWAVPQVAGLNLPYFEVLRRKKARVIPFVWSPVFLEEQVRALPGGGVYQASSRPRRLSVMEPNINVVKFCLYPVLIAELAYRARPESIARLQVTNAEQLATQSPEFVSLMNQLDIVRDSKAVFVGRYETPSFLAGYTDVVISHQLGNPLNYFYLEVCWQGYPLIHNASMCQDMGYYYEDNDVAGGAEELIRALQVHDAVAIQYRQAQRDAIARHLPDNPNVVSTYSRLLEEIMARPVC